MPAEPRGPHRPLPWLSAHLPVAGDLYGAGGDRTILGVVAPVARHCRRRGWIRRAFFLRYSEGGPRVRFRLQGEPRVLERRVRPLLADRAAASPAAGPGPVAGPVAWVPYEPEVERYGGPHGVGLAEDVFDLSSRVVAGLLAGLPSADGGARDGGAADRSARLGRALLATLTALTALVGRRPAAAALIHTYGSAYLRQRVPAEEQRRAWNRAFGRGFERQADALAARVEHAWGVLAAGGELPPPLDLYRRGLAAVRRRLEELLACGRLRSRGGGRAESWNTAVWELLPSYLHMTHNRLGVTVTEESYLALVIAAVLAPRRYRLSA